VLFRLCIVSGLCASIAGAQADTIIQPGHLDFGRYDTPGVCSQAVASDIGTARRARFDPGPYQPDRDTLPPSARNDAQRCGTRFEPTTVAERARLNLVRLALSRGDEKLAQAAGNQWIAAERTPVAKARAMELLAGAYLNAVPMQRAAADAMARRLDSLGRPALLSRAVVHAALWDDADRRFDTAAIRTEGIPLLAIDSQISASDALDVPSAASGNVLLAVLAVETFRSVKTAVERVMQFAREVRYKFPGEPDQVAVGLAQLLSPYGHPPPTPVVSHWFGPHAGSSWNIPGKVSILFRETSLGSFSTHPDNFEIQRLRQRYGDSLGVTILTRTAGYIRDSGPLEPAQEADSIRRYLQDDLKLPATVAVQETPFHRLPDGRRVDDPMPDGDQMRPYDFGAVVVDREGNVMALANNEAEVDAYLDRAIPSHQVQ
jgi:hypothetical protein